MDNEGGPDEPPRKKNKFDGQGNNAVTSLADKYPSTDSDVEFVREYKFGEVQSSDDQEGEYTQNENDGGNGSPNEASMEQGQQLRSDSERTDSQVEYRNEASDKEQEERVVNNNPVEENDSDVSESSQVSGNQETSDDQDSNSAPSDDDLSVLGNVVRQKKMEKITTQKNVVNLSDEFAVNESDFETLKLIGMGGYGHVFLVRKLSGHDAGQLYAMKVISKLKSIEHFRDAKHVLLERRVLEEIQGMPFLVGLHYAFKSDANLFLVMDFVQGGELFRRVQSQFPKEYVPVYMAEMVEAVHSLHQLGYMYRDLKLENVLFDSKGHIVLVDMGMVRKWSADNRGYNICGTVDYMAPEMLLKRPEGYDEAIDWWALGMVVYEILTDRWPFGTRTDLSQTAEIARAIVFNEPDFPEWMCPVAVNLLKGLLQKDPRKRLRYDAIKQHPYFAAIDWDLLRAKQYNLPCKPSMESADVSYFDPTFTEQPLNLIETKAPPPDIHLFEGFNYVAPQHLEEAKDILNEDIPELPDNVIFSKSMAKGSYASCEVVQKTGKVVKITHMCQFRLEETDALRACSHPNIVKFYDMYRQQCLIYVIMEELLGGNLARTIETRLIYEDECRTIFVQLVKAVFHLHSHQYIHGDIEPENVVFRDEGTVVLVNFGKASYGNKFDRWLDKPRYTMEYAPDELLADPEFVIYSPAVDIFGLGATLYAMVVGHSPYRMDSERNKPSAAFDRVLSERRSKNTAINKAATMWLCSNVACRDLMSWCLETDPKIRPSLMDILRHPWLMPYKGLEDCKEYVPHRISRTISVRLVPRPSPLS